MEPVCRARRTVEDLNDLMESGSGKYILVPLILMSSISAIS